VKLGTELLDCESNASQPPLYSCRIESLFLFVTKSSSLLSWPVAVEVQPAVCAAQLVHHARTPQQHALATP